METANITAAKRLKAAARRMDWRKPDKEELMRFLEGNVSELETAVDEVLMCRLRDCVCLIPEDDGQDSDERMLLTALWEHSERVKLKSAFGFEWRAFYGPEDTLLVGDRNYQMAFRKK